MVSRTRRAKFRGDVVQRSAGDTGWVSFELDPLIEDVGDTRSRPKSAPLRYVELRQAVGGQGHDNRMIKVPATTEAGLAALEELSALPGSRSTSR